MLAADENAMQGLVLHAVGDLRLEEMPRPGIAGDQVRVRVGFCGVCGSDIPRIFVKGTYHFPLVCGHEFAGVVHECGPDVEDLARGDRVVVFPLLWCGKCPACEQGKYVQCYDYDYLGSRSDGAFADYVVAPRRNLIRCPDGVSLEEAAMTEPASVALHALRRAGRCSVGESIAIFGAGPIGLMVAQWARAMGATQVLLFDIMTEKLALANELGFDMAFDSRKVDPAESIASATDGQGAHVCIDAAGVPQTLVQALTATRRGGRMVLLGNPSADVTLSTTLLSQTMRREVTLYGTWNSDYSASGSDDDWRTALDAMASGKLNLLPLISHLVPLSQATDVLHGMRDQDGFFCKVLIHPESEKGS